MNSQAQIVATIGPSTQDKETVRKMVEHNMGVARLNSSWGTYEEHADYIKNVRESGQEFGKHIPIILDLSGPRMEMDKGHKFDDKAEEVFTSKDLDDLKFGIEQNVDYVAMSYVGDSEDILKLKRKMEELGKVIPIIAKIERKIAISNIDEIMKNVDAIMIARGDLGNEVPLEQIPFIEKKIIQKCKIAGKPVIVATQMMLSMTENKEPTRAEVTDVVFAILSGADAVMLSEESATGKYPLEAVIMMEKVILESTKHSKDIKLNRL